MRSSPLYRRPSITLLTNRPIRISLHTRLIRHILKLHVPHHILSSLLHLAIDLDILHLRILTRLHSVLLLPANVAVPQVFLGINVVPDALLEYLGLRKSAFGFAVPE